MIFTKKYYAFICESSAVLIANYTSKDLTNEQIADAVSAYYPEFSEDLTVYVTINDLGVKQIYTIEGNSLLIESALDFLKQPTKRIFGKISIYELYDGRYDYSFEKVGLSNKTFNYQK